MAEAGKAEAWKTSLKTSPSQTSPKTSPKTLLPPLLLCTRPRTRTRRVARFVFFSARTPTRARWTRFRVDSNPRRIPDARIRDILARVASPPRAPPGKEPWTSRGTVRWAATSTPPSRGWNSWRRWRARRRRVRLRSRRHSPSSPPRYANRRATQTRNARARPRRTRYGPPYEKPRKRIRARTGFPSWSRRRRRRRRRTWGTARARVSAPPRRG